MKTVDEIKNTPNLLIMYIGEDGGKGYIYKLGKLWASVVFSWGCGWEHISVSPVNLRVVPSWEDMCRVKDMFFYPDEWAVQYHPAQSEYVNNLPNCLHIWRPTKEPLPIPPSIMTGIKAGQGRKEIKAAIAELEKHQGS